MPTTNSNVFRNQVQRHVLNSIEEPATLQDVLEDFNNWYSRHEQRQHPNRQEAFQNWLMCLPTSMSVYYQDALMEDAVQRWFETAEIPFNKKKNFDYPQYYLYLVSKEFFHLLDNPKKVERLASH